MQNTRSHKHVAQGDAQFWARRHRIPQPLDTRTTKRFAREFEAAVRQRGKQPKEKANLPGTPADYPQDGD